MAKYEQLSQRIALFQKMNEMQIETLKNDKAMKNLKKYASYEDIKPKRKNRIPLPNSNYSFKRSEFRIKPMISLKDSKK
jgi:hypothetical protein